MAYYGKRYIGVTAFDPNSLVQVSVAASLTAASVNKTYILNAPANYTLSLPQTSTVPIGSQFTFLHNATTGSVTISAYAGNFIQTVGVNVTGFTVNPGETIILEFTGTYWNFVDTNKIWTAPQGQNDTTPASTAFVQNEFGKHKNYVINGNFDFWQRGITATVTNGNLFAADRWYGSSSVSTIVNSQQPFVLGQTAVPNEPTYFHRSVVSSVASTTAYSQVVHKIESVRTLAGKTATLSFYAKADSNKNIAVEFYQGFGTGGSPSTPVSSIGVTTFSLTTSWQKFNLVTTMPTLSGKVVGSGNNDYLAVVFWFDAGSALNARSNSLGQQSGTFDIAQVQIEEGSVTTQFEYRNKAIEFTMCQRYCVSNLYMAMAGYTNTGIATQATGYLPVVMRAVPSFVSITYGSTGLGGSFSAVPFNNQVWTFSQVGVGNGGYTAYTSIAYADAEL